ncbi:hypothetical protein GCM10009775_04950 [Microbacterium aoyamense]|uniref:Uncharacterized protein n=1 Tax=Microbacterium aoyamense TaxID=344166 RepID=A0ABN2P9E7_9MICO|nr:hypothetical protein [Microbacterium aoyamense]
MTAPAPYAPQPARPTSLIRAAIWVAIGALIAAAIVCVVWIFVGASNGIIGKAFLSILLLVAFSGAAILDAHLAPRRPAWFALSSMAGWVLLLLIGAVMIWMPERSFFSGYGRFIQFLLIVLIVQLVLLHVRLFTKASQRYVTPFTQVVTIITIALVVVLAALLIVPLVGWEYLDLPELYWRFVVAVAILAAVGTMLIPLVNVLFAPKKAPYGVVPQTAHAAPGEPLPWPTFVDNVTPLPVMPDGSPDWGAYYTGYPSPGAVIVGYAPVEEPPAPLAEPTPPVTAPTHAAGARSGYEGYPPAPPLPPLPPR